jgi:hypothetical protein
MNLNLAQVTAIQGALTALGSYKFSASVSARIAANLRALTNTIQRSQKDPTVTISTDNLPTFSLEDLDLVQNQIPHSVLRMLSPMIKLPPRVP